MNYIKSVEGTLIQVKSILNGDEYVKPGKYDLESHIRESIYLAINLKCSVELNHRLGEYLIDRWGEVQVVSGTEPNRDMLPEPIIPH